MYTLHIINNVEECNMSLCTYMYMHVHVHVRSFQTRYGHSFVNMCGISQHVSLTDTCTCALPSNFVVKPHNIIIHVHMCSMYTGIYTHDHVHTCMYMYTTLCTHNNIMYMYISYIVHHPNFQIFNVSITILDRLYNKSVPFHTIN